MTKGELINWIKDMAVDYSSQAVESVNRNKHMNSFDGKFKLPQDKIDALLVDFINYCAMGQGMDYAMYARDMKHERDKVQGS
jgi:hypothetical protein